MSMKSCPFLCNIRTGHFGHTVADHLLTKKDETNFQREHLNSNKNLFCIELNYLGLRRIRRRL